MIMSYVACVMRKVQGWGDGGMMRESALTICHVVPVFIRWAGAIIALHG